MNVLITSTARRIDFVGFFQEAYRKLDINGKVIATDPEYNAPSLQQGDISYVVPAHTDPEYANVILEICKEHEVKGILPLNDLEVAQLIEHKDKFMENGISVFVPSADVNEKIRDKGKYEELLGGFGVKAPKTFSNVKDTKKAVESGELDLPVILKPRNGSASVGIEFVYYLEDLEMAYRRVVEEIKAEPLTEATDKNPEENVIIQQVVEGDKFSLDIFNDLNGHYVTSFVRKQLAMRGGDVDRCIIYDEPVLHDIARKIGENLGHVGYINTDVYYDGKDYYVIDINPRVGGGYAFSHHAGADLPSIILALLSGQDIKKEWAEEEPGLEFARHDVVTQINKNRGKRLYSHS
ncbi:ATP-grasp domain-containing protein [Alkalicoccus daliensis]|uniref:Carbamoyl-phosphate synthase large subunit n=1 Tax=Alkalicoccus daliensis TaxID=745820 RepID=A0A1H0GWQ5_9BACI|nr:ATP-grasp domain-containing protein [Alkalicoccus daliensis]SDO11212.1 carbamoyl-phosphate synthase large subunit [Alkalicoccus daliensis]